MRSINLLVLLAGVLSDGQLESRPWLRYYKAAIASLEDLPAPPTLEEEVNAYDCYASILVCVLPYPTLRRHAYRVPRPTTRLAPPRQIVTLLCG